MDAASILIYIGIPTIALLLGAVVYFVKRTLKTVDVINEQMPFLMTTGSCEKAQQSCFLLRKALSNGGIKAEELANKLVLTKFEVVESRIDELFHMVSNRMVKDKG